MANVFRKKYTTTPPADAEVFDKKGERFVKWKTSTGKTRIGRVVVGKDGAVKAVVETSTYMARYRDAAGVLREVSTGCRDETNARKVLADLLRRAELVKSGVLSADEDSASDQQSRMLDEHLAEFQSSLELAGTSPFYRSELKRYWKRLIDGCGFRRLADLTQTTLERFLADLARKGVSARSRNAYREAAVTFCNWCLKSNPPRLLANPLANLHKADVKIDRRRPRRSLTPAELVRLLDAAHRRPLDEAAT
ncbi:MAG: hypothetical protein ACRDD1_13440, partial [Planctomycetia bacterium]